MLKPFNRAEIHFHIHDEIGHAGQNSTVYTAHDIQLDATLAIKKIAKTTIANADEYFLEASLLYQSSHPNIVPVHYACQDGDHIYLAMPYYPLGSLKKQMGHRSLTLREIIIFATQILSGLHNIHSKRLIHFDVKPDNILISQRGEALLADFGLAKQTSYSGMAGQDRIYGNMAPPESFTTSDFSRHFDIYQIGLTLHRMCKGDESFYSDYGQYMSNGTLDRGRFQHAVLTGQFPNRDQYPEHIPQRMINTINRCLQIEPSGRFQSALDVVNALSEIEGNLLDWQYEVDDGSRSWSKTIEGRSVQLNINHNHQAVATQTSSSGSVRRIKAYCVNGISRQQIKQFLREK
jgi:serine/threonine protein kinase